MWRRERNASAWLEHGVVGGGGYGGGIRPLPFLYASSMRSRPRQSQANTGPSMCLVPPEGCEEGKCGVAFLIGTSGGADVHMQVHIIKLNRIG